MTVLLNTPDDLTLEAVRRVAWDGEDAELMSAALDAIGRRRTEFLAFVDANLDRYLYGITTGHDTAAKTLLDEPGRRAYGALMPATPPTTGPPLPDRVVRAVLLARLADVLHGTAPVRPETAQRLVAMLRAPELPAVPATGNGEPGDIIALGALLRPEFEHTLEIGEGMFLVNGSPVAAAVLADGVLAARERLDRAERVLALAAVAASSPDMHYDEALGRLWRDPHQAAVLGRFRELLAGTGRPQLPYQAPVSFRSAPRVLGAIHRALAHAEECATIGLAAASNNPVFTGSDVLSNGGYHNPLVAPALDALTHGWADLTHVVTAQVNRVIEVPDGVRFPRDHAHRERVRHDRVRLGRPRAGRGAAVAGRGRAQRSDGHEHAGRAGLAADRRRGRRARRRPGVARRPRRAHARAPRRTPIPPALAELHASVLERFGLDVPPLGFGDAIAAVLADLTGGP